MSRSLGRSLRPLTLPTPTLPRRHRGYARRRRPAVGNIGSGGKQQQDSGGVVGTTRSMFALFRHIQLMRAVRRIPALLRSHQQLGLRRVSGRPRHPAPGTVRRVPRRGRHRVRVRRPTRRRRPLTYTSAPAATPCCRCRGPNRSRDGGTGRRAGLKIQYWRQCASSSLAPGTKTRDPYGSGTSESIRGVGIGFVHWSLATSVPFPVRSVSSSPLHRRCVEIANT